MSLLTVAEADAILRTGLATDTLQKVINREEAWLARRVGALIGERTETFHVRTEDADDPLHLQRPTSTVDVEDNGVAATVLLLRDGTQVEKTTGWWVGPVAVTYTPNDSDEVTRVVIELVRLAVNATAYESETIGDYSYSRSSAGQTTTAQRNALARELQPMQGPGTIRLRSALETERVEVVTP